MPDTLRQLGRELGRSARAVEFLNRRGGLLPQVERTRGNMVKSSPMIAPFTVRQQTRRMSLNLTFFKASIL